MKKLEVQKVDFIAIEPLRALFLAANRFQIRFDAVHSRGWVDEFLLLLNGQKVGYASIKGLKNRDDRDSIFEFFLMPDARETAAEVFRFFLQKTGAKHIECQTNEPLLSALQKQFSVNFRADALLFGNPFEQKLPAPEGCVFREITPDDRPVFEHRSEPEGNFGIEKSGAIVATGGFLTHYNFPFADLFMEVRSDARMLGIGSFLIQELIKSCFSAGRIPAARCNPGNLASQKTLLKGGFQQVGSILIGDVNL